VSLDFYLEKRVMTDVYWSNYTHNVTPMWDLAGVYNALYNSDGKKAKDIIQELDDGVAKMVSSPKKFIKLNPKNGWGSYDTALDFLREVLQKCRENPTATIRISK
jgi:hypothetical protein